jgi:hypothetical protein
MAEVQGDCQYLGQITGTDQQVGAGLTYPHPLFPSGKPLTGRRVKKVIIRADVDNVDPIKVSNKATPGTAVLTMMPGESRDWIAYRPGERWSLGSFFITTSGGDHAEVSYILG